MTLHKQSTGGQDAFVCMRFGDAWLAIPEFELVQISLQSDVYLKQINAEHSIPSVRCQNLHVPVYGLDEEFELDSGDLLEVEDEVRYACVLTSFEQVRSKSGPVMAMLCDEVEKKAMVNKVQQLPEFMRLPENFVHGITESEYGEAVFVSNTFSLAQYLDSALMAQKSMVANL